MSSSKALGSIMLFFNQKWLCKYSAKRPLTIKYILSAIKYAVFAPISRQAAIESTEDIVRWQSKQSTLAICGEYYYQLLMYLHAFVLFIMAVTLH